MALSSPPSGDDFIRQHYIAAVQEAKDEHGFETSDHEIRPDATLKRCIGYSLRFVVGEPEDQEHFRYDKYWRVLDYMWRACDLGQSRIVSFDIGCGPGLFSWVVHDYTSRRQETDVDMFGFDHAPQMCRLAKVLWDKLGTEADLSPLTLGVDGNALAREAMSKPPSDLIISFGHVLVQNAKNDEALSSFAEVIAECVQGTQGACVVVASDAHNRPAVRANFRKACSHLFEMLVEFGLVADPAYSQRGSQMYANLTPE